MVRQARGSLAYMSAFMIVAFVATVALKPFLVPLSVKGFTADTWTGAAFRQPKRLSVRGSSNCRAIRATALVGEYSVSLGVLDCPFQLISDAAALTSVTAFGGASILNSQAIA